MKKIGDITNTADKNGEFSGGNINLGIPPTMLESGWFNSLQREVLAVLKKANVEQDPNKDNQLVTAILEIVKSSSLDVVQEAGGSEVAVMSQKAVSEAISDSQVNVPDASTQIKGKVKLTNTFGDSETLVPNQKLVSLLDSGIGNLYAFNNINVFYDVIIGSDITGANHLTILGTRYPLNSVASGTVTEINVSIIPPYIKTDVDTYILKDVTKDPNTVEAYWAKSDYYLNDGSINPFPTNNTPMLQIAWDHHYGELHYQKNGAYYVRLSSDGLTCIKPKSSHLTIVHGNRARTFIETNSKRSYKIYDFQDSNPVIVNDLIAEGDVATHIPTIVNNDNGGEWGHGFDLTCAKSIVMNRCWGNRCWGDGFYIGSSKTDIPDDVVLVDCGGDENRRQGLSGVAGNCKIIRFHGKNTGQILGTEPMSGMDIEPNPGTLADLDYQIIDPIFENNKGGGLQLIIHSAFNAPTMNNSGVVTCKILVSNVTSNRDGKIDRGAIRIGGYIPNLSGNQLKGFINLSGVTTVDSPYSDALQLSNFTDKFPKLIIENFNPIDVYSGYQVGDNYGTTTSIVSMDFQQKTIENPLFKVGHIDIQKWSYKDTRGNTWSPVPTAYNHRVKRPIFWRFFSPLKTQTFENLKVGDVDMNITLDDWHFFFNSEVAPQARIYGKKPIKVIEEVIHIGSGDGMYGNGIDIVVTSKKQNPVIVPLPKPTERDIGTLLNFKTKDRAPSEIIIDIPDGVELIMKGGETRFIGPAQYKRKYSHGEYNFYCASEYRWCEI